MDDLVEIKNRLVNWFWFLPSDLLKHYIQDCHHLEQLDINIKRLWNYIYDHQSDLISIYLAIRKEGDDTKARQIVDIVLGHYTVMLDKSLEYWDVIFTHWDLFSLSFSSTSSSVLPSEIYYFNPDQIDRLMTYNKIIEQAYKLYINLIKTISIEDVKPMIDTIREPLYFWVKPYISSAKELYKDEYEVLDLRWWWLYRVLLQLNDNIHDELNEKAQYLLQMLEKMCYYPDHSLSYLYLLTRAKELDLDFTVILTNLK